MRLRTQLLLINIASSGLLIAAVVFSYSKMLLSFHQATLLTVIALCAGFISSVAFWMMTIPISRSMSALIQFAREVGDRHHQPTAVGQHGPLEIRWLTQSVQEMHLKLSESFEQLETMERVRRELVANVSHDLRTPIASIQSFVEALQDGVLGDKQTSDAYLATIHREVLRLGGLIDDLFELSRLEAGQQPFVPVPVHVDDIILQVLESQRVRLKDKQLRLNVHVDHDLPILYLMPDKIARVFHNIIDNALRHAPNGTKIDVLAHLAKDGHVVEITVRDKGKGISSEDATRVFNRFYRADAARQKSSGGAGLGLAIAQSLIELHGGEIGVRSPLRSMGSEFWFTLPTSKPSHP